MEGNLLNPERVIEVSDAFRVEWYAGDTIVAYVPLGMSSEVLQVWSDTAVDILRAWPLGQPYLALYDFSGRGVIIRYSRLARGNMFSLGITEQGNARVRDFVAQRDDFTARVALSTSLRHSGYVGGILAEFEASAAQKQNVKYDVFYEKEAVFAWLRE